MYSVILLNGIELSRITSYQRTVCTTKLNQKEQVSCLCEVEVQYIPRNMHTVFALLCFVVVIHWLNFPISIRLTSLALWQSNDCPSTCKATLMNMDKYFMWIHYERLHNHNKTKHNKTVCIFLGIYCTYTGVNAGLFDFYKAIFHLFPLPTQHFY